MVNRFTKRLNMKAIDNSVTPEIFTELRLTGPFVKYEPEDIVVALKNSLYDVLILSDENEPIGMARLVGDDKIAFFIKDLVVIPAYQKKKVGTLIMEKLFEYIKKHACYNAYIGLMSTPGKEGFYEKFGFIRRPNEDYGAGMIMYYKGE